MIRDLRCPSIPAAGKHHKLFGQLDLADVVFRVACADCRKLARRDYPDLALVLHCYSALTGELEYSLWQWPNGTESPEGQAPLRAFRGGA